MVAYCLKQEKRERERKEIFIKEERSYVSVCVCEKKKSPLIIMKQK